MNKPMIPIWSVALAGTTEDDGACTATAHAQGRDAAAAEGRVLALITAGKITPTWTGGAPTPQSVQATGATRVG